MNCLEVVVAIGNVFRKVSIEEEEERNGNHWNQRIKNFF